MKTRVYMSGGWTVQEYIDDDGMGLSYYWIVSPKGKAVKAFPTKLQARLYWRKNQAAITDSELTISGRKLAQSCGITWDRLSEHEQASWDNMAAVHGDNRHKNT